MNCPICGKPAKREHQHGGKQYCSGTCVAAEVNKQVRASTMARLKKLNTPEERIKECLEI